MEEKQTESAEGCLKQADKNQFCFVFFAYLICLSYTKQNSGLTPDCT